LEFPPYIALRAWRVRARCAVGNPEASVARAMIVPLAVAQFIASYAATNMNVAIGTIDTDLDTSVPGLQTTMTLFPLHHGVVDDSREQAVRHLGPHKLLFTAGLIGYGAGATMAMLAQPRPDGRRVLAPRGCGFGVDDPTGVHTY
jgi:hypothetical protein